MMALAVESNPADWYQPEDWSGSEAGAVTLTNRDGTSETFGVAENGMCPGLEDKIDNAPNSTLKAAYQALYEALQAQVMVRNMAKNLDTLLFTKGITIAPQSGQAYTVKFGNSLKEALAGATDGTVDATSTADDGPDEKSLVWRQNGDKWTLEVNGWYSPTTVKDDLSTLLVGGRSSYKLLVRTGNNAPMQYMDIGQLSGMVGGAPPDETSITTNATGHKGELRLKNMDDDEDYYLPYNYAGSLLWGAPTMWDGDTVQWTKKSGGDGYVAELAGFTTGGAIGAGHYYGMAVGGNSLGFHELPNVTTNTVVADGVHLTTDLLNGGETKRFKFALPSGGSTFLVGRDGFLPFNPDATTNGAAEVKVDDSSITTNGAGEVELKGWPAFGSGFLAKTDGGALAVASLTPTNGLATADGSGDDLRFGLAGWDRGACNATISSMLTDDNDLDRNKHLILAKYAGGADDDLHYVPIGDVIKTNAPPKDITINGVTGTNFVFEAASDSDVRFTVEQGEDGAIHIKVGVYWQ